MHGKKWLAPPDGTHPVWLILEMAVEATDGHRWSQIRRSCEKTGVTHRVKDDFSQNLCSSMSNCGCRGFRLLLPLQLPDLG
jgi:hypothetical protein